MLLNIFKHLGRNLLSAHSAISNGRANALHSICRLETFQGKNRIYLLTYIFICMVKRHLISFLCAFIASHYEFDQGFTTLS